MFPLREGFLKQSKRFGVGYHIQLWYWTQPLNALEPLVQRNGKNRVYRIDIIVKTTTSNLQHEAESLTIRK